MGVRDEESDRRPLPNLSTGKSDSSEGISQSYLNLWSRSNGDARVERRWGSGSQKVQSYVHKGIEHKRRESSVGVLPL